MEVFDLDCEKLGFLNDLDMKKEYDQANESNGDHNVHKDESKF